MFVQKYLYILQNKNIIGKKKIPSEKMKNKSINIWIWIQNGRLMKAITCADDGTIRIYDEDDTLVLKRTGLNPRQVKQIETLIIRYGAQRLDKQTQPFRYL